MKNYTQVYVKSNDYPANALKYRQNRGIAGRIYYQFTTNGQSRDMRPQSRGQTPKGTSDRQLNMEPYRRRFFTPGKGEQERRFFHARRYAVGAKKPCIIRLFRRETEGARVTILNP